MQDVSKFVSFDNIFSQKTKIDGRATATTATSVMLYLESWVRPGTWEWEHWSLVTGHHWRPLLESDMIIGEMTAEKG